MASGERLRVARQAIPMSTAELAAQAGIIEAELLSYEEDQKAPAPKVVWGLAQALGIEMSFLLRTMPLTDVTYMPALTGLSDPDREIVIARAMLWLEQYIDAESYLEDDQDFIDFEFPEGFPVQAATGREAALAADTLRQQWQIASGPLTHLADLLEAQGIKVGLIKGVESFSACACWTQEEEIQSPFIIVNADLPGHSQRYAIARELAYLMVDGITPQNAGHFAGAFLLPEHQMRQELGSDRAALSFAELNLLKQRYRVGIRHLLVRSLTLHLIEKSVYESWVAAAREWDQSEPGFEIPREVSHRHQQIVLRLLAEEVINSDEGMQLLSMTSEAWEALLKLNSIQPAVTEQA